jgi:hypothetical protein
MRFFCLFFILFITAVAPVIVEPAFCANELVLYGFERDPQGWEIPDWAITKKDHVARQIGVSEFQASEGRYALQVDVDFDGAACWEGAYVERVIDVTDWSPFRHLSVDIFLPKDAPRGLRARVILTVGEDWKWTETNKSTLLTPGEWTVIKVDMTPQSMNWRRFVTDEFRSDVRKLGLRVESNGKITYRGPVYVDNVKLSD